MTAKLSEYARVLYSVLPGPKDRRAEWSTIVSKFMRHPWVKEFLQTPQWPGGEEHRSRFFDRLDASMKELTDAGMIDVDERIGTGRAFGYRQAIIDQSTETQPTETSESAQKEWSTIMKAKKPVKKAAAKKAATKKTGAKKVAKKATVAGIVREAFAKVKIVTVDDLMKATGKSRHYIHCQMKSLRNAKREDAQMNNVYHHEKGAYERIAG